MFAMTIRGFCTLSGMRNSVRLFPQVRNEYAFVHLWLPGVSSLVQNVVKTYWYLSQD